MTRMPALAQYTKLYSRNIESPLPLPLPLPPTNEVKFFLSPAMSRMHITARGWQGLLFSRIFERGYKQFGTVQDNAGQCRTVQDSAVQSRTVQDSLGQCTIYVDTCTAYLRRYNIRGYMDIGYRIQIYDIQDIWIQDIGYRIQIYDIQDIWIQDIGYRYTIYRIYGYRIKDTDIRYIGYMDIGYRIQIRYIGYMDRPPRPRHLPPVAHGFSTPATNDKFARAL